jgi:hypothetical protein
MIRVGAVLVATGILFGCSKGAHPPHAIEDAAAASQRASEAMKNASTTEKKDESAAKPAVDGTQVSKPAPSQ